MGHTLKNGRTIPEMNYEELKKIREEAQESTRIAWLSLVMSVVATAVAILALIK